MTHISTLCCSLVTQVAAVKTPRNCSRTRLYCHKKRKTAEGKVKDIDNQPSSKLTTLQVKNKYKN